MLRQMRRNNEAEPLLGDEATQKEPTAAWDVFENPPKKNNVGSVAEAKVFHTSIKYIKTFTVFFVFCVVLVSAVFSKSTLLLMTSQIKKNITRPYCNEDLDRRVQFIVTLPTTERAVWIWLIMFAFFVPELGTFLRSVRIIIFKSYEQPKFWEFITLMITESLPTIGSAILVFVVFPELDVVKAAMLTNAVCFIPAVIGIFSRSTKDSKGRFTLDLLLDCLCIAAQASSFVVWPLIEDKPVLYFIPVAVILISIGWWENFVSDESDFRFIRRLAKSKQIFPNRKYVMYLFISVWKCILFFISVLTIIYIRDGDVQFLFDDFYEGFSAHQINITGIEPIITSDYSDVIINGMNTSIETNVWTPIAVWLVNIGTTYICYAFGKFACKVMIQGFGFAFPINLTVPVLLSLLIGMTGAFNTDECTYSNFLPSYLFFTTPPVYFLQDFVSQQHSWIWLIWLLSQAWITIHIWTSNANNDKLSSTEKLFMKPMYDAFLIDQSVALNRRRAMHDTKIYDIPKRNNSNQNTEAIEDDETRIYACGTMWHETKEEMMEFLKSIMRMDEDQCAHRMVRKYFKKKRPDYYEFETHIFFDDAFVYKSKEDHDPQINEYVKLLIDVVDAAASEVHQVNVKVRPPQVATTPYGGRLTWILPGKTKMIAHLKDKSKIRAKKRWSQVMYMYYLLGHKLMANDEYNKDMEGVRVDTISENTYILALDGDIDFQPSAVKLLVDYMKRNKSLGAACGRIHPIGSGAMVWYQIFEYAVGHWMQKATEHVIGCVLCSPGCFSLFRGKALMDHSVMAKYTTVSTEAMHYVQYDQGEDRWLCTLLLQRGYRVEYSAASDAYTHCPEGFNEFYNQRRRWMPSTTANIFDLLSDYKQTVKVNNNISSLYIIYQMILMIGTVIGPGTIFLMLVGAFVAAFRLDQWSSFWWNVVPILIFVIVCATCKSDTQLLFAGIISGIYGLIMMAVFVGVMLQISEDGFLAPSSLFFFFIAGEMILAALMHPKEFYCLKYGVIYYVTVPSMYMLLVIYSVFNMNNVSWGTREVTVAPQAKPPSENIEEEKNKPKPPENKVLSFFGGNNNHDAGSVEFNFAGLFKCLWCTHQSNGEANEQLRQIQNSLGDVAKRLEKLERFHVTGDRNELILEPRKTLSKRLTIIEGSNASRKSSSLNGLTIEEQDDEDDETISLTPSDNIPENTWCSDGALEKGHLDQLDNKEIDFWNGLIKKYLHPIDDTDKKDKIAKDLKDLRDKMVVTFFMLNSLYVLVLFLLTLEKDSINVKWPIDPKINFTYIMSTNEIQMYRTYLQLEPIGFVFLIFFFALMIVQFFCMCVHRFGTFSQIIANTNVTFSNNTKKLSTQDLLEADPVKIVKEHLQSFKDEEFDMMEEKVERRKTMQVLVGNLRRKTQKVQYVDLEENFRNKFDEDDLADPSSERIRRKTVMFVNKNVPKVDLGYDNEGFEL